jgi:hypothetical protein
MNDIEKLDVISSNLVGLLGKKQSGKDTIAEHLVEEYGFVRYAFADPIKEACQVIFGFNSEQCWGNQKEVVDPYWNITPRKIFQIFGTELFQFELPKHAPELADIGRTFWAYRFARWYEQQITKTPELKVVITDVRFPFEAELVNKLGGIVVKINRPNLDHTDMHASEVEMETIPYKYLIDNNSTLEDLKVKVDKLFSMIF